MLSNKQTEIPMAAPTGQEKLVLSKLDSSFTLSNNPDINQSPTSLAFNDRSRAAQATYTLKKTALIDIDNSGHARRVGFVSFEDGDSSAGCGDFSERDTTPVYIDDRGVADPRDGICAAPTSSLPCPGRGTTEFTTSQGSCLGTLARLPTEYDQVRSCQWGFHG